MKYIFVFVFVLTFFFKLVPSNLLNMPFTTDQGRDLIDVRQIWEGRDLKLIGPTTSINGVHLGPLYYYLISIPYLLTSGSPVSILIWQLVFFHLSVLFFWITFKKKSLIFATIVSSIVLMSPISFYANRYFWNANFMISFTIIYFTLLLKHILSKLSPKQDFFLGLISGLSLQIEAAFGVLFLPFTLLNFFTRRLTLPQHSRLLSGFFITLIPQVLFELAKGFPMTKIFLSELSGQSAILGEKMIFSERLIDRFEIFKNTLIQSSNINPDYLLPIFFFSVVIFVFFYKKKIHSPATILAQNSFLFIIFSFLFYTLYSSTLKVWYVYSISIVFCLFLGSIVSEIFTYSKIGFFIVSFFVLLLSWSFVKAQREQLAISAKESVDPSGYQNQITVVEKTYELAKGNSFLVYSYIPSIYDYPFQYLFWSHGLKKYGYSPNDLGYLPNQPEYIKNKNSFLLNQKDVTKQTKIILIIQKGENSEHFNQWMGNFAHLCNLEKISYKFGQDIVVLQPCSTN